PIILLDFFCSLIILT
ncbi:hypothetical protein CP02DC14_0689B, partial [Chlamydia psittaci 02DC14]